MEYYGKIVSNKMSSVTVVDYSTLQTHSRIFKILKEQYENIVCDCWGLYELSSYEEQGSQGTRFVYIKDDSTKEKLFDYVNSNIHNDVNSYLIVPIKKTSNGTIYIRDTTKPKFYINSNITEYIYEYEGTGYVLVSECGDQYRYGQNKNEREWIEIYKICTGIEDICADAYAIDSKPEDWNDDSYHIHKSGLNIVWKE